MSWRQKYFWLTYLPCKWIASPEDPIWSRSQMFLVIEIYFMDNWYTTKGGSHIQKISVAHLWGTTSKEKNFVLFEVQVIVCKTVAAVWRFQPFLFMDIYVFFSQDQSELMLQLSHLGDPRNAFLLYFPLSFCLHKATGEKVLWLACLAEWINAILKWWVYFLLLHILLMMLFIITQFWIQPCFKAGSRKYM